LTNVAGINTSIHDFAMETANNIWELIRGNVAVIPVDLFTMALVKVTRFQQTCTDKKTQSFKCRRIKKLQNRYIFITFLAVKYQDLCFK